MLELLFPLFAGLVATFAVTPLVRRMAHAVGLVAKPVADRWHVKTTPMMGGVAVYFGFMAGSLVALRRLVADPTRAELISNKGLFGVIVASSLMFVIGLADDKF